MITVEVYRLWKNGTWDKVPIDVDEEPWNVEIVESRAVTRAWLNITRDGGEKPNQIGLYMPSFQPMVCTMK